MRPQRARRRNLAILPLQAIITSNLRSFVHYKVLATMFITFGLFNLIMAVFVESTLAIAKTEERMDSTDRMEGDREQATRAFAGIEFQVLSYPDR